MSRTEALDAGSRRARRITLATVAATLAALAPAAESVAVSITDRTLRVSTDLQLGDASGASQNPALSVDGRIMAFETVADDVGPDDVNGAVSDIVAVDLASGARRLVTEAADGPSVTPAISGGGGVIAFVSFATNLFAGDTNGQPDILVRAGRAAVVPVSVAPDGSPANGPSYQPDISNDGRFVAFASDASNLVSGDTNGRTDVFVRDLALGRTELVSRRAGTTIGNARSSQPALSGDGRFVAFESAATNLVSKDTNGVADVFVRDRASSKTERVSLSTAGKQQDKAVPPPFTIAPDISRDGRYVVFESDAAVLARDGNRRTDVFLRDRRRDTTRIVSANSLNVQGDNDSFNPRITANGRYLAFQSFATNLVARGDDGPREDIFVRDLRTGTTTVGSVTNSGDPRAQGTSQFLQRPTVSDDARVLAFASSVPNLVANDGNDAPDVFLRRLDAPTTRLVSRPTKSRRSVVVSADDRRATRFVCLIDDGDPFSCDSTIPIRPGRSLTVRAGGPGLMFDPDGLRVRLSDDRTRPSVRISPVPGRSLRTVRGTARDRGGAGLDRVEVSVVYLADRQGRCKAFDGRGFVRASCQARRYVRASGRSRWRLRLPEAIKGPIALYARSIDQAGNVSRSTKRLIVLV